MPAPYDPSPPQPLSLLGRTQLWHLCSRLPAQRGPLRRQSQEDVPSPEEPGSGGAGGRAMGEAFPFFPPPLPGRAGAGWSGASCRGGDWWAGSRPSWAPATAVSPSAGLRGAFARGPSPRRRAARRPPLRARCRGSRVREGFFFKGRAGSGKQQESVGEGAGQPRRAPAASCCSVLFLG